MREQLFCDWYIKLMHITDAATRAGYSPKTAHVIGSNLLKKVKIQEYIKLRKTQLEELFGFNKGTVVKDFLDIKDMSMKAVPVMRYDPKQKAYVQVTEDVEQPDGKVTNEGVYQFDSNGANRALENISKIMGYNAEEKVKHSNDPDNPLPAATVLIYMPDNGRDKKAKDK